MPQIKSFELRAVEIPFRQPFKHAAAERRSSNSILLKCTTDTGISGFGECLPRVYVTGESRDGTFRLLSENILPRLVGRSFKTLSEVMSFLDRCNGIAPSDWVEPGVPHTAAWAAVDLALLDAFGKALATPVRLGIHERLPAGFRYSIVTSVGRGLKAWKTLAAYRLYGFRQAKVKVDADAPVDAVRLARRILGRRCDLRVDANMAWDLPRARDTMHQMARLKIMSFEQPLAAGDISGMASLVRETGLGVMADESVSDAASLEALIAHRACTAINARISKCGGLVATANRCRRALEAGLVVQAGVQVGETSLLSAAQLILIAAVRRVTYGEGCYGRHLLKEDPFAPVIQFGRGGRPPGVPKGPGLGVRIRTDVLDRWTVRKHSIG